MSVSIYLNIELTSLSLNAQGVAQVLNSSPEPLGAVRRVLFPEFNFLLLLESFMLIK